MADDMNKEQEELFKLMEAVYSSQELEDAIQSKGSDTEPVSEDNTEREDTLPRAKEETDKKEDTVPKANVKYKNRTLNREEMTTKVTKDFKGNLSNKQIQTITELSLKRQAGKTSKREDRFLESVYKTMTGDKQTAKLANQNIQRERETAGSVVEDPEAVKNNPAPVAALAALETERGIRDLKAKAAAQNVTSDDFVKKIYEKIETLPADKQRKSIEKDVEAHKDLFLTDADKKTPEAQNKKLQETVDTIITSKEKLDNGKKITKEADEILAPASRQYFAQEFKKTGKLETVKAEKGKLRSDNQERLGGLEATSAEDVFEATKQISTESQGWSTKKSKNTVGYSAIDRVDKYTRDGLSEEAAKDKAIKEASRKSGEPVEVVKKAYSQAEQEMASKGEMVKDKNIEASNLQGTLGNFEQRLKTVETFIRTVNIQ